MKGSQVIIGRVYIARVSGNLVPIRVLRRFERFPPGRPNGLYAWECRNERTGRAVVVKSAQRFRGEVEITA